MNRERRLPTEALKDFTANLLGAAGVPEADAEVVAGCMIKAHLRGFDTHGLPCLPGYVAGLKESRINPRPQIKIEQPAAWSAGLDADNGLGHIAAHKAMRAALKAADELGVGAAVVRRSNHFGAASAYALMALAHNCIGIVCSNASSVTAPFGSLQPLFGTNPLSVAIPAGRLPPFVIDMATSEGSRKKIRQALDKGDRIPPGWALDTAGNPTIDPAKALDGVMLPFGGMKGSAITMLLDILSGVLSGANYGGDVLSVFTNQERESGNGNFFLAFKVASFMPVDVFKNRMDDELNRIRALRPAEGFREVIYPGFKESVVQEDRSRNGIPINTRLAAQLSALAAPFNVESPWQD